MCIYIYIYKQIIRLRSLPKFLFHPCTLFKDRFFCFASLRYCISVYRLVLLCFAHPLPFIPRLFTVNAVVSLCKPCKPMLPNHCQPNYANHLPLGVTTAFHSLFAGKHIPPMYPQKNSCLRTSLDLNVQQMGIGHLTMEVLCENLQQNCRGPDGAPWSNPGLTVTLTVRIPQCGHTVWGKTQLERLEASAGWWWNKLLN